MNKVQSKKSILFQLAHPAHVHFFKLAIVEFLQVGYNVYITARNKEITLELAKDMIDKLVKSTRREVSIDYIQKVVCNYFSMPVETLSSKTRKREIVQARQIAMYFAKTMTKSSLAAIGAAIGNKDHATVLHAFKTVNNLIDTDKKFKADVEEIEKRLKM